MRSAPARLKALFRFLGATFDSWLNHEGPRLSAALAFYSVLSLAPLALLLVSIAGLVLGQASAHSEIISEAEKSFGSQSAYVVDTVLKHLPSRKSGFVGSSISLVAVLFGASTVFAELRSALNKLWDVRPREGMGIFAFLKERFFAFLMVLGIGLLSLVFMLASAAIATVGSLWGRVLPFSELGLSLLNSGFSFAAMVLLFALIFRYVPDVRVGWKRVWWGSVVTAFLFTVGKQLTGLYLGKTAIGSAYGAAGSLVVLIAWVYYSSMSFYYGAEITCALDLRTNKHEKAGCAADGQPSPLAA